MEPNKPRTINSALYKEICNARFSRRSLLRGSQPAQKQAFIFSGINLAKGVVPAGARFKFIFRGVTQELEMTFQGRSGLSENSFKSRKSQHNLLTQNKKHKKEESKK